MPICTPRDLRYYRIGAMEISPDSHWLAFCEDTTGRRQFTLKFKDLRDSSDCARGDSGRRDRTWRGPMTIGPCSMSRRIPRHCWACTSKSTCWGRTPGSDALIFEQTDRRFYTGVSKSKSDAFIFLHMESTLSSEWRYARADDP